MKTAVPDKYALTQNAIALMVAFLIHLPELLALTDRSGQAALFPDMSGLDVAGEIVFAYLSMLLLFALNVRLFRFDNELVAVGWRSVLLSFGLTWGASSLLGKGFVWLHGCLDFPAVDAQLHRYLHPLRDVLLASVVTGSCYLQHLSRESRRMLLENQQLRTENLLNRFEALKSQLNPHMLFNSLNTLCSLIREDGDKAQRYLQELSRVLRYTLQQNENNCVSVDQEMESVRSYIYLLQMRYEDNLRFHIELAPGTGHRRLPSMALQLLIENAVKHNEISNRHPLTVSIRTAGEKLVVSNPRRPKTVAPGSTRVGLDNRSKRYRLLTRQDIEVRQTADTFTVTLPLI